MRCQHDQCKKRPHHAFEGEKPKFCGAHRLQGMVDVHNKHCQYDECNKSASLHAMVKHLNIVVHIVWRE